MFFLSFLLDPHSGCPWVFPSSHTSQPFPQASLGSRAQRVSLCQGLPSRSCSTCLRTFLFLSCQHMKCSLPDYMAPQLPQSRLYLLPYPVASIHQLRWNNILNLESILDAGIGNDRAVEREIISLSCWTDWYLKFSIQLESYKIIQCSSFFFSWCSNVIPFSSQKRVGEQNAFSNYNSNDHLTGCSLEILNMA